MTELKTLKDLEPEINPSCENCVDIQEMCLNCRNGQLRHNATEWILAEKRVKAGVGTVEDCNKIHYMNDAETILNHIFNLTEKNLEAE